ncbi:NUDIX hydrolase [Psychromicrobium xiongbiense]|uniref:NUDIX hydrolase n=1 Tax=Psychromicrobium xiongbiense TaxID=3051184 RepID=UPI00255220A7|nr:NUDIX hydrolase [Psychromicrobium sp. YIM S02556]
MSNDALMEKKWLSTSKRTSYRGRMLVTEHAVVLPDGSTAAYEVDESIPFAAATLVYDGQQVLLTRQYRYPIDRWIFDLPGGAGDAGEEPAAAARRELEEELGLVAHNLQLLHTFYVNPGRVAWPVHVFGCTTTSQGTASLDDPAEQVRLVRMPLRHLDELIVAGDIVDPTLLIARTMAAAKGLLPALGG